MIHNVIHENLTFATTSPRFALLFARCSLLAGRWHCLGTYAESVCADGGELPFTANQVHPLFTSLALPSAKWLRAVCQPDDVRCTSEVRRRVKELPSFGIQTLDQKCVPSVPGWNCSKQRSCSTEMLRSVPPRPLVWRAL